MLNTKMDFDNLLMGLESLFTLCCKAAKATYREQPLTFRGRKYIVNWRLFFEDVGHRFIPEVNFIPDEVKDGESLRGDDVGSVLRYLYGQLSYLNDDVAWPDVLPGAWISEIRKMEQLP